MTMKVARRAAGWGRLALWALGAVFLFSACAAPAGFTLSLYDGGKASLSDFRGKPVVLNFWASWCAPCRAEVPDFVKLYEENKGDGLVFVGVNIQDTEAEARKFIQEFGIPYPVGPDTTGEIAIAYGVKGLPTTVFINEEGAVYRTWAGLLDQATLASIVTEMTGKEVRVASASLSAAATGPGSWEPPPLRSAAVDW